MRQVSTMGQGDKDFSRILPSIDIFEAFQAFLSCVLVSSEPLVSQNFRGGDVLGG